MQMQLGEPESFPLVISGYQPWDKVYQDSNLGSQKLQPNFPKEIFDPLPLPALPKQLKRGKGMVGVSDLIPAG